MKHIPLLLFAFLVVLFSYSQSNGLNEFSVPKGDDELSGVKDANGKIIVPAKFYSIRIIDDYILAVGLREVTYFDNKGKQIAKYCEIKPFINEISIISTCVGTLGFDGLMNKQGKIILAPNKYHQIAEFNKYGLAEVTIFGKNDKISTGLVDTLGRVVAPCKYEQIDSRIGNGLIAFKTNGKWGYMNLKGQEIIKAAYDTQSPFKGGKATVFIKSPQLRQIIIDTTGKMIQEVKY